MSLRVLGRRRAGDPGQAQKGRSVSLVVAEGVGLKPGHFSKKGLLW